MEQIVMRGRTIQAVAAAYARAIAVTHLVIPETASQVAAFLDSIPLNRLEVLDVSNCRLLDLPLGLSAALHTLNVEGNPLGDPPSWLAGLTGLKTLVWNKTGARSIPDLAGLTQLATLSLMGNELIEPPRWAHRLPNLQELRLDDNPLIDRWKELIFPLTILPPRQSRLLSGSPLHSPRAKSPRPSRSPRWGMRTSGSAERTAPSPDHTRRLWTSRLIRSSQSLQPSLDEDQLSPPQSPHLEDVPRFDVSGLASALETLSATGAPPALQYLRDLDELCSPLSAPPNKIEDGVPVTGLGPAMASQPATCGRLEYLQKRAREEPVRREMILAELIESEQRYVHGLETLVEVYLLSLRGVLPSTQERVVFGNVESLLAFHRVFLPSLQAAQSGEQVGRTFLDHMAFLRSLYMIYISTREEASRILERWRRPGKRKSLPREEKSSDLSTAQKRAVQISLHKAASDPRTSSLGLGSYLLLPVQRIPQYRLFLEDLVRCSPLTGAAGEALSQLLRIAGGINEAQKRADMERRLAFWEDKLAGLEVNVPHRRLLREGELVLQRIVRLEQVYLPTQAEDEMQKIDVLDVERPKSSVTLLLCSDVIILVLPFSEDKSLTAQLDLCDAQRDGIYLRLRGDKAMYYLSSQQKQPEEAIEDWAHAISEAYRAFRR